MEESKFASNELLDVKEDNSWKKSLRVNDEEPKTCKPNITRISQSSTMKNVKNFLPQLQKANQELPTDDEELNIENIDGCEQVIEMDLAMMPGILDTPIGKLLLPNDDSSDSDTSTDTSDDESNEIKLKTPNDIKKNKNEKLIEEIQKP